MSNRFRIALIVAAVAVPLLLAAQRRGEQNPFPGGTNPDGSLRPAPPLTRLFTQDAYTEYAILAPGSNQFRIQFIPEETRAGATELVNATRGGSEGSNIGLLGSVKHRQQPERNAASQQRQPDHERVPRVVAWVGLVGEEATHAEQRDHRCEQQ